ncbi:MAG: PhzF family phenazine biosynthesis protein [Alphaproteobacteria bacterium]|nr:PhzF family phenazine biosynthesis protein [Alphaproteobacteria bacterium]
MKIPLYLVDAFAERPFAGNPAAVCPLKTWLPDPAMQAISAEMNLSETAFLVPTSEGWHIRWFTPTLEVDLVGHATLAAAFVIFERLDSRATQLRFASRSGPLLVQRNGSLIAMDFPARVPERCLVPPGLIDGLGATPAEVFAAQHYLAVFEDENQIRGLTPRMDRLADLDRAAVIVTAPGGPGDFVSRFFAPANGVPEDPVSGVAHCTLIPYWARRLGKARLLARQVSRRGGDLVCEDRGERVIISGPAILVLEGTLTIDGA